VARLSSPKNAVNSFFSLKQPAETFASGPEALIGGLAIIFGPSDF
jgi:hypothetical protein